ncbi:MAG TPA: DNA-processing protein DprA, partial [Tepidisphaeraceae bacterium]|nr:DNA-processing protein DprA [Tepidisphaeraceae bacterium]
MGLVHWLSLAMTRGLGPVLIARLIERAGDAETASAASGALLREIEGIGRSKADAITTALRAASNDAGRELERCGAMGITHLTPDDDDYPPLLRDIPDPPPVLWLRGSIEPRDVHGVAIVGSRKCSLYGREQAERFAQLLAGAGVTVLSGGARGIDSSAHRGALTIAEGRTLAVLGSALDVPYPPENKPLFEQIAQQGAVLSEHPLGTPPLAEHFPRRNRIVSGMSRGVLVIEADERSGALITARQAIEDHNRPVFAVPGRIDNALSAGPHQLIRDGAMLTARLEDILDNLGPLPERAHHPLPTKRATLVSNFDTTPTNRAADRAELSPGDDNERQLLACLDGTEMGVDELVDRSGLP